MKRDALFSKLKEFGLTTQKVYMDEAFSRNIGLLTEEEQEKLANATVAIPGMGGVGGVHLVTLVRTGVGRFHLADFDTFEPANVNRQFGARVLDFGRPKLEVMVEQALSINPYLEIKEFPEPINSSKMDEFLDGVQVVLDGLDFFNFDTRRLLFNRAREKGIYVITAGPLGFSSAMLIFSPYEGMGFDEYFDIRDQMPEKERLLSFAMGLAPRATHIKYMDLSKVDLDSKAGPSLSIACQACSAMAATEALRILLKRGGIKPVPHYFQFDPYLQKYRQGYLRGGNRNPIQQIKMKYVKTFLLKKKGVGTTVPPEFPKAEVTGEIIPEEVMRYIIRAGIQAPSGDNAQPWKFSWQCNTISLYLNREADHSFFNIKQLASIISCGAAIENMRLAATAFGLEGNIAYLPDAKNDNLMASIELCLTGREKDPLHDSIWNRCTNRKLYDKKPIPESILGHLASRVSDIPGAKLHLVTDESDLKKIAKMVYKVDRIRTEHRPLHEHLCKMIRFTDREAQKKRDGLPLKNLEAGLAGEVFLRMTRPWWVMNLVNTSGLGRMVALHSYQAILNSSAAALLTVRGMKTEDFLRGGQALERVWLAIPQQGLSIQPMTAITLFYLRWQLEGEHAFSEAHRRLLQETFEEYRELFQDVDFEREGHVMLFRLGYGKKIKYGTFRKDIDSLLV